MENDIKSLRRQLLKTEIEEQGLAVVAKKAGKPDRQINDMAAGRKTFGDKIARAIGPLIRPDLAPDWLLSPSPNVKKAPATTQLPDSPTQQDAVPEGAGMPHYQGNLYVIPIFRLEAFMCNKFDDEQREGEIPIPGNISKESFALRAEDDTLALASPSISKGMVVVFDPKAEIRHQAIVLAGEPGTRPVIRQLICDGHDLYLSAPQSGLPLRKIEHKAVLAVAVKAVIDLL